MTDAGGVELSLPFTSSPARRIHRIHLIATLRASGSAWGTIRRAFLRMVTHAGPKAAIDGCTRHQPNSSKAGWISHP